MTSSLYEAIFESSPCAIFVADDSGTYVEVNPAAQRLLGLPREKIIGKRVLDFVLPTKEDFTKDLWDDFRVLGEQAGHFILRAADGGERLIRYAAVAGFLPGLNLSIAYEMRRNNP